MGVQIFQISWIQFANWSKKSHFSDVHELALASTFKFGAAPFIKLSMVAANLKNNIL